MPKIKADIMKAKITSKPVRKGPLWAGPCGEGNLGGVTQSMIGQFLNCRERFRIKYVEGFKPDLGFSRAIEYGQMWHLCEEHLAAHKDWEAPLTKYAQELLQKFPMQQAEVEKWYMACRMQFPIYIEYWSKHQDVEERTPLMQEQVFDVPYTLPSGRVVRLRGKFDGVDLIGKGKKAGVYLFETKTKGDIDEQAIKRQQAFDLQSCTYLVALQGMNIDVTNSPDVIKLWGVHPIRGIRYNVVRRPLSGGRGTIKQKEGSKNVKPETADEYWARLQQYFKDEPEYFFMRWKTEVQPSEIVNFETRCLKPLLEQICDWYEHVTGEKDIWSNNRIHHQHPFGVVNYINESGASEYDEFINSGSTVGLKKVDKLFEELA